MMRVWESLAIVISSNGPQGYGTVRVALYRVLRCLPAQPLMPAEPLRLCVGQLIPYQNVMNLGVLVGVSPPWTNQLVDCNAGKMTMVSRLIL